MAVAAETEVSLVVVEVTSYLEERMEVVPSMEISPHHSSFCLGLSQIGHRSSSSLDVPQMLEHSRYS